MRRRCIATAADSTADDHTDPAAGERAASTADDRSDSTADDRSDSTADDRADSTADDRADPTADVPLRADHADRLITRDYCPAAGLPIESTTDPALNHHSTVIFLPTMTTGAKGFRDHD